MKGHRLLLGLKRLCDRFRDKSGSAMVTVVILGAAVLIIVMALLSTISTTLTINESVDNSENAYLAARSGITMLTDAGTDSSFATKLINSAGNSTPIEMDLGAVGSCQVYVTDAGNDTDPNGVVVKKLRVKCIGSYEGNEFTLTRYLTLKQTGTVSNSELRTGAYTHFGDGDIKIDGGIEGNVYILGNGHIENKNSNENTPMHDVVCANELVIENSDSTYDLLAVGKYLYMTDVNINNELYVGSYKRDGDGNSTGELRDDIYCHLGVCTLNSVLRCEGVTILDNSEKINLGNALEQTDAYGNTTITGSKDPSQKAIVSGGDLYLGYSLPYDKANTYKTGDSYKNPASTVDTSAGLTATNAGQVIYGTVVSGGDINIASTAEIYGDIIAKGDVIIRNNCTIHGKIYAGGNVIFMSSLNTSVDSAFPDTSNRVVYAGGTFTANSPNIPSTYFEVHEGSTPYSSYFTGDFVGAAEYFNEQYENTPKPTTSIPSRLYELPETMSDYIYTPVMGDCYGCSDKSFYELDPDGGLCWGWSSICNPTVSPEYWLYGWQHISHTRLNHISHQIVSYIEKTPREGVDEAMRGTTHITTDTRLVGDFDLSNGDRIYIDASGGNNIDILLQGNITIGSGNGSGIYINDNAGESQIRLFMTAGSSITNTANWGATYKGVYVISDDDKDLSVTSLPSNGSDSRIDITKVPQFYIFAEEGATDITLDVGTYGYIPGYVLTPYLDIASNANSHCYQDGTPLNSQTNYPFFYGMLMCNSMDFGAGQMTYIKYDWRLEDIEVEDDDGTIVTVKSETRKKFDQALARDSVMYFADSNNVVEDASGSSNLAWVVTGSY